MYDLIQHTLGAGFYLILTALPVLFFISLLRDVRCLMKGKS